MKSLAAVAIAVVATATLYAGIHWGSTTGGGADSYGYLSQAGLWLDGQLSVPQDLVRQSPWPSAAETWAPLGFRPSPHQRDAIVPLYAPGLPLLMALAQAIGGFCAAFLVVPVAGALTIVFTAMLGERLFARPLFSVAAAVFVATSPVFLYQLMNPMTDVPVTAAWTLSLVAVMSGWPIVAGVASGIAILIRPNLAPVAVVLAVWLWMTRGRVVPYLVALVPAIAAVGVINARLYESAWTSGYGALGELYAAGHIVTNVRQFSRWLFETQTPAVLLALLFFVAPRWFPEARAPRPRLLVGGVTAAVLLSYLFYQPFDAWWYLRFLLPIWPVMAVLTVASIEAIMPDAPVRVRAAVCVLLPLALAVNGVNVARARYAFDVGRGERRYIDVARFVEGHTDASAVMIALQHSGTLRMYAGRQTLRFDQLDPLWLDRAVAYLQAAGHHPYIVLEAGEHQMFEERFGGSNEAGRLTARPFARLEGANVSIYDATDRRGEETLAIAASAQRRAGWRCDPPPEWRARRGKLGVP